jgi:hypothetical protein
MTIQLPKNLYLGGGAYGCIYHIGIIRALYEANIRDLTVYGNSAGALIGVFYILQMPADEILNIYSDIVTNSNKSTSDNPFTYKSYQITQHIFNVFDNIHKYDHEAYKKCSNRLNIGVTTDNERFIWKDKFTSQSDLFNALLCSFNIPYVCNYHGKINGVKCVDAHIGFISSRDLPDDIFEVTLFGTTNRGINANIPFTHRYVSQPKTVWENYFKHGYDDMKEYLKLGKINVRTQSIDDIFYCAIENALLFPNLQFAISALQQTSGEKMYDYSNLVERYD